MPVNAAVCGLRGSLSLNVTCPLRVPATVGVKLISSVQLLDGLKLLGEMGQLFVLSPKLPVTDTEVSVKGPVPMFCRVSDCVPLVVFNI